MKKLVLSLMIATAICGTASAATTPAATAPATAPAGQLDPKNWDSLNRQQKLQLVEQKHQESIDKSTARWKGMTDDEKIAQFEKRHARYAAWHAKKQAAANSAAAAPSTSAPMAATATPAQPAKQ